MAQTTSCRFCGYNIDVEIALLNTGRPDICDNCAIEKRSEVKEQQIIETLATKVMGWHRELHPKDEKDQYGDFVWCNESGEVMALVYKWNPLQNIADAWMIVQKMAKADPVTSHKFQEALSMYCIYDITPERICEAALKAIA
ncbi:hypothetical protein FOI68_22245 [Brevibacillus sp. LEMMJ03]|uniref:BC1872 family protein n=1 Tax=Brevibacillus sp. LEMMJ03 TaxID=2595056 RepID=UPI001180CCDA|nr:hypothetical protein [Brevibacillus sp. LEMMJ03]TRY22523.1 hypothetical protein FOI68_22245 [Brevibacillus sp. LEMMJ03]